MLHTRCPGKQPTNVTVDIATRFTHRYDILLILAFKEAKKVAEMFSPNGRREKIFLKSLALNFSVPLKVRIGKMPYICGNQVAIFTVTLV